MVWALCNKLVGSNIPTFLFFYIGICKNNAKTMQSNFNKIVYTNNR